MQAIPIAESLWLEPTLLGATLNYAEPRQGWHYRVGIGFRSLTECDKALKLGQMHWTLQDQSFKFEGVADLTLVFCPGTEIEKKLTLSGPVLEAFKHAIQFLSLASQSRMN